MAAIDADGRESLWWSGDRHAYNRTQGLGFGTKRGDGFAAAALSLPRRIDRDWPDAGLLDAIVIVGDDGSIAYEGRIAGTPRSTEGGDSLAINAVGWMAEARRYKVTDVFIDQDPSHWGEPSLARRIALASAGHVTNRIAASVADGGLVFELANEGLTTADRNELVYSAPRRAKIAKLMYVATQTGSWTNLAGLEASTSDSDDFASFAPAALTGGGVLTQTNLVPARFVRLRVQPNGAVTPGTGTIERYSKMAAYGDHGLPLHPALIAGEPDGPVVSDIIRYTGSRYVPKLSMAGVKDTTYPVRQAAFRDAIYPYDIWLELNRWHLWGLEVWEHRTLHYDGVDLSEPADWQVSRSEISTTLQGDTTDNLANGVAVEFTDLRTGRADRITPDDYAELRDDAVENPANRHGDELWLDYRITVPCLEEDAVQFGRAVLAEFNAPKQAGTIKVAGHVRDSAGHWQQVWKMRAGDTISITDFPNDRPRLIVETDYNDDFSLDVSVDSTFQRIDAAFDRLTTGVELIKQ
ncbi:MAG: hypothetical protein M3340_05965 [Actinomycetota bacterium]|nr:hypothetical protein [Actinomycetota bacterium]